MKDKDELTHADVKALTENNSYEDNPILWLLILGFMFGNPLKTDTKLSRQELLNNINQSDLNNQDKKEIMDILLK